MSKKTITKQNDKPTSHRDIALYRCKLSCKIGKDACEGVNIPGDVRRKDWIFYQLFSAVEDMAIALGDGD